MIADQQLEKLYTDYVAPSRITKHDIMEFGRGAAKEARLQALDEVADVSYQAIVLERERLAKLMSDSESSNSERDSSLGKVVALSVIHLMILSLKKESK